ncbi:hypothetical protein Salat_1746300 [Sesamum alatum]|uniref:Uncharacterized protein n=1 Tax=Sesamum alatum TaxID=300844 RepID=A0AAE2CKI6_9LAMI|nr:hypothetical protein Salat_1746300 [Sesamum alatum]
MATNKPVGCVRSIQSPETYQMCPTAGDHDTCQVGCRATAGRKGQRYCVGHRAWPRLWPSPGWGRLSRPKDGRGNLTSACRGFSDLDLSNRFEAGAVVASTFQAEASNRQSMDARIPLVGMSGDDFSLEIIDAIKYLPECPIDSLIC